MRFRQWHQPVADRPEQEWPLLTQYEFGDFQQFSGSFWMPTKVEAIGYVSAREPESLWNSPADETVHEVHELNINDRVADSLFKLTYPPMTVVWDYAHNRHYRVGVGNTKIDMGTGRPWYARL